MDGRIECYFDAKDDPKANWCVRWAINMDECPETDPRLVSLWAYARATAQVLADDDVRELIKTHPEFTLEVVHKHGGWRWIMKTEFDNNDC